MTRRFTTRTAGIFAALLLASCFGDSTGPGERRPGMISIAPDFNVRGINSVDVNRVLIRFTKPNSTVTVYDTIVPFPASTDTLDLSIQLAISGPSEQFLMTILMIDDPAADTVFQSGPTLITAVAGVTPPVPTPATFTYVGVGSHAAGVRFLTTPSQVLNGDTVLFAAEAFDSSGATIPNTPIVWSSSDTVRAKVPADSIGRIIGGVGRGNVTITAALLTPPTVTSALLVQPKPATVAVLGGSGQTGPVGLPLSQPVSVQVKASDNLGVQGVVVNFAVTTGGGTLSQLADTTDANGNASVVWTLGGTAGAQSVGVTVGGVAGTTSVPATGVAGAVKKLGFQTLPASVVSGQPITPAITVAAQDSFGNPVASFTGAVTLAIGVNPAGGTLSGTTTVAAAAGLATFSGLSIDNIGASYTFVATATGLVSATSGGLAVTAPAGANAWINAAGGNWGTASNWSKGTVPSATDTVLIHQAGTYTVNLDVSPTVARLDLGTTSGLQTLSIAANTLTMNGNGAVTTNGRIVMTGGTITGPGVVDISGGLDWQGGTLGGGGGTLRIQPSGTLSISGATARSLNAYTLEVNGGGAWSGNGVVNSGSGAVLRVGAGATLDISGDPQFLYNQGGAASRLAVQPGATLRRITSTNPALLTVVLDDSGSVLVNAGTLQANGGGTVAGQMAVASGATLSFGGGIHTVTATASVSGAGTVEIPAGTVDVNGTGTWGAIAVTRINGGSANFNGVVATTALDLTAGTLGAGAGGNLQVAGPMTWSGGSLSGSGGVVTAAGSVSVTGSGAGRSLNNLTLELQNAVNTWAITTAAMASGSGGTLRLNGGNLSVTGDFGILYNQGGAPSRVAVFGGVLSRTTSVNPVLFTTVMDDSGLVQVQTGTLQVAGGGSADGNYNVSSGATVDFAGGVHTFTPSAGAVGAGIARVSAGTVNATGGWNITGATQVAGGTLNMSGGLMSTTALDVTGGTVSGTGLFTVSGALTWSGGSFSGGNGTTSANGTLSVTGSGAGRSLNAYVLRLTGTGSWATTGAAVASGSAGLLQIAGGAQLDVTGDFGLLFNQGGAASRVAVQAGATLRRTTSTNPVQFTTVADDSGTVQVLTGTLQLDGGGTSSGSFAVSAGAALQFGGGTHTLSASSAVSGAGTVRVPAGTLTAGGGWTVTGATQLNGGAANFNGAAMTTGSLAVSGGTLGGNPGGLLSVSGAMNWTGGNLIGAGGGGTTRVASGGTLAIAPAAGITLNSYTLQLDGTGTWTGTQLMSSGAAGTLRVSAGAILDVQGAPTFSFNQGGTASLLNNLGTINRTTSAANFVVNVPIAGTGAWNVTSGSLDLQGGGTVAGPTSVAAATSLIFNNGVFTYTSPVTGAGTFLMNAGTVNYNTTMNIGTLTIAGGSLILGGSPVSVTGNFSTSGAGALSMTSATDSLDVNGNATFGGGASTLSAGGIRLAGNFAQSGAANSFAATGTHHLILDGAVAQTISFTNATSSFFRRLEVNKSAGGVVLNSDTRVTGTFRIVTGTSVTGPTARLTVQDSIKSPTTLSSLTPLVVEVGNWLPSDSGAFSPDTAVFLVGSATGTPYNIPTGVFTTYVYKSIRVAADTVTALGTLNVANDLVVGGLPAVSATLALATGATINVTGNLRTEGNGKLKMTNATTTLNVTGNATFAGGATTGLLSTGLLVVRGNFSQSGNAASFAASGTHATRFNLAGSAVVQNINFANPTTSAFDSLDLNRGPGTRGTVNFQTDARILRGLSIQNSTDVTGATARISIVGGSLTASQSTTSPTMLTTRALELAVTPPALANMVGAVNISPDTVVINTGITTLPVASGLRYNSIRVNTGATLTMSADTINKDVDVASGTASFPNTFRILGKLRTRGTGLIAMPIGGAPNVTVADSAIFGGGSTAGQLTTGTLHLLGDFVQTGTNTFQASQAHATAFENTTRKTISMAAPGTGAAQSRFAQLVMDRAVAGSSAPVSLGLLTSIQAALVRDSATGAFDSIFGTTNQVVTTDSIQISNMVFDHTPLVLGSTTAFISANNTRWQNMDPTSTYLTLTRSLAGASTFGGGTTMLGAPTTGKYFSITTTATHSVAFIAPINPAAASMTGLYTKVGATTSVTWGGVSLP